MCLCVCLSLTVPFVHRNGKAVPMWVVAKAVPSRSSVSRLQIVKGTPLLSAKPRVHPIGDHAVIGRAVIRRIRVRKEFANQNQRAETIGRRVLHLWVVVMVVSFVRMELVSQTALTIGTLVAQPKDVALRITAVKIMCANRQ